MGCFESLMALLLCPFDRRGVREAPFSYAEETRQLAVDSEHLLCGGPVQGPDHGQAS